MSGCRSTVETLLEYSKQTTSGIRFYSLLFIFSFWDYIHEGAWPEAACDRLTLLTSYIRPSASLATVRPASSPNPSSLETASSTLPRMNDFPDDGRNVIASAGRKQETFEHSRHSHMTAEPRRREGYHHRGVRLRARSAWARSTERGASRPAAWRAGPRRPAG